MSVGDIDGRQNPNSWSYIIGGLWQRINDSITSGETVSGDWLTEDMVILIGYFIPCNKGTSLAAVVRDTNWNSAKHIDKNASRGRTDADFIPCNKGTSLVAVVRA